MLAKMYPQTESVSAQPLRSSDSHRVIGRTAAVVDVVLVVAAFLPAIKLRELFAGEFPVARWQWVEQLMTIQLLAASWVGYGTLLRLYDGRRTPLAGELRRISWVALLSLLSLRSLALLLDLAFLSRPLALVYVAAAFAATTGFRLFARVRVHDRAFAKRRVIVVGSGSDAAEVCRSLVESGADLVGVIPDGAGDSVPLGTRHLGSLQDAEHIFRREVVDEVLFAVPKTKLFDVEHAFTVAEDLGLETKLCVNFLPNRFSRMTYEEFGGRPLLVFTSAPTHPVQIALKRAFDLVVSAIALILLSPAFLLIAIAIKLTSKGPIFYGQRRTGLNGRDFVLWKFRSMEQDAEKKLASLIERNEMSGPASAPGSVFKLKNDPRVTPIGHLLRRTSLDELPQFWNVFVGEMSIVGPRPLFDVKKYDQRIHCRRISVKPGITCTWQISGRNEIDFARWMQLDLDYIDRWSLRLDLEIFLATIPAVVRGRGAR